MLVAQVLGDCPGCGRIKTFGNVDVFGAELVRGCGYCEYSERIPLPPIRKKILYLDQFFFSHAFRGSEKRFVEASERIGRVAAQQLLTAPYSSVHETETLLWARRDELREFIKRTSRGAQFVPSYRVKKTQIVRAFQAWLSGKSTTYALDEHDAIDRDLHRWDSYFFIDLAPYPRDIEQIRTSKHQALEELLHLFDDWRVSTSTFEEDVETEHRGAAKGYIHAYSQLVARCVRGDFSAMIDAPITSMVVEAMMLCLPKSEAPEDRLRKCGEFFKSQHFKNVPSQMLPARMYAQLKSMVKQGAYAHANKAKKALSGFFYDVEHISTYSPYCDAIIIDQPMAELVSHPKVALQQTFGVKVFSRENWDDLLCWLDTLEASVSAEHRAAFEAIHARPL